jgi:hypothetical protein
MEQVIMADWYGHARSNYFRVKDQEKFEQWADSFGGDLEVIFDGKGRVGLLSHEEKGRWPLTRYNEETEEEEDIDLIAEVGRHLQEDSVAVLIEVGAEKLRYLTGWATAVNSKGYTVDVDLDEIYERANDNLGDEVTDASY